MLNILSDDWNDRNLFIMFLLVAIVLGMMLQWSIGIIPLKDIKTKTPIVPDTTINCVNGVCDTIYIYKF